LHPERALKYNYCMAPACQEKNAKGLTMVAVGMNKAADELVILEEQTRAELASGRYQDQRRGSFGKPAPAASTPARRRVPAAPAQPTPTTPARRQWNRSQERLALLYNQQGLRPAEIADKLGVSTYLATQIILAARNHRKP
jgi:hypothetical protein